MTHFSSYEPFCLAKLLRNESCLDTFYKVDFWASVSLIVLNEKHKICVEEINCNFRWFNCLAFYGNCWCFWWSPLFKCTHTTTTHTYHIWMVVREHIRICYLHESGPLAPHSYSYTHTRMRVNGYRCLYILYAAQTHTHRNRTPTEKPHHLLG